MSLATSHTRPIGSLAIAAMAVGAGGSRHHRRSLFSMLVLGLWLSGCVAARAKVMEPPAVTFDQHEVVTGSAKRQTVLTGFLLGGAVADLAVLNVDANGERRLRI